MFTIPVENRAKSAFFRTFYSTADWETCNGRKIGFYLSNPCFEFWLLLHLCDIKNQYALEQLKEWLQNADGSENVQGSHQIEVEVSAIAHHKKRISQGIFDSKYWPNISVAIERSKEFAIDLPDLMDNLGTNLSDLLLEIPGVLLQNDSP